jgi:hypothetical protein
MTDPYLINSKIPQDPDKIWAVAKKRLPGRNQNEFLYRPRYVFSGKNVRIAYPGFLTWLKFIDPDRRGEDLDKKVVAYNHDKSRYEQQIAQLLKEFREGKDGKKFAAPAIIMAQIDRPGGHLLTFQPSRWDQTKDPGQEVDDAGAAVGEIHPGFLSAGSAATIRASPEALNEKPEAILVADQTILHEMVHAMFSMHGKSTAGMVNLGWEGDFEFNAIQVENVYRSEKGVKKMRASHADDTAFMDDTENLLDHTEIHPAPRILLGRFKRYEPEVFGQLALIPQAKAKFNPFREYKEEQDKKGTPDD